MILASPSSLIARSCSIISYPLIFPAVFVPGAKEKWPNASLTPGHFRYSQSYTTAAAAPSSAVPSSSSPLRRSSPSPSVPSAGHLPNKPGSAFLSDVDDCFFDAMRVWKDEEGKELTEIPTFRLLDGMGKATSRQAKERAESLSKEEALHIYHHMMLLPQLDQVLYSAQRQGRISFWMTSYGEEAAVIGTASALSATDEVYSQYRELGLLLYRGLSLDQLLAQVFGTDRDKGKARQMPTHIGSAEHHFHTISSPLATQIPQAAGSAYALKRIPGREGNVVGCWFGEGASSEGDFHAGLNIASTLNCPVLWLARNNGFAISTPATEQYRGDGLASRGPGYGTLTIRVDGNDVLAVKTAVEEAKKRALRHSRPILIELMTYRVGHHSTSDDSGSYRPSSSVEEGSKLDNPLHRFRSYLYDRSWWDSSQEANLISSHRKSVLRALANAEKEPLPDLFETLFEDTWQKSPPILLEQKNELKRLVGKYGQGWEPWRKALERTRKKD